MRAEYYFKIADCIFGIFSDFKIEIEHLFPSYRDFVINDAYPNLFLMELYDMTNKFTPKLHSSLILEETNDMGHLSLYKGINGYCLIVDYLQSGYNHVMFASSDFKKIEVFIRRDDPNWNNSLNSMIRFAFSQAILSCKGVSIHASAICIDGNAYLFMGKSGTGKSTHASLWKQYVKGAMLLNDDNPTIRVAKDGRIMVYGTPWSGKTSCYVNESAELKGVVRLFQADENRFLGLTGIDAFMELIPGCMAFPDRSSLYDSMCDLLQIIVDSPVVIGRLSCLPQKEAVLLCYQKIK